MRNVISSRPARLSDVRTAFHALPVNSRPGRSTIVSSATTRLRQPCGTASLVASLALKKHGIEARALGASRMNSATDCGAGCLRAERVGERDAPRPRASGRRRCPSDVRA